MFNGTGVKRLLINATEPDQPEKKPIEHNNAVVVTSYLPDRVKAQYSNFSCKISNEDGSEIFNGEPCLYFACTSIDLSMVCL